MVETLALALTVFRVGGAQRVPCHHFGCSFIGPRCQQCQHHREEHPQRLLAGSPAVACAHALLSPSCQLYALYPGIPITQAPRGGNANDIGCLHCRRDGAII